MKFKQIENSWDKKQSQLQKEFDLLCEARFLELNAQLHNFKITKLIMGMGSWTVEGEKFDIVYDDDSEGQHELQEIFYWLRGNYCWEPKKITNSELKILHEIDDLCEFWVDKTGGKDVFIGYNNG
jgi:hypothetical protein